MNPENGRHYSGASFLTSQESLPLGTEAPKEQEAKTYGPEQRRDFMIAVRITTLIILSEDNEAEGE